MDEKDKMSIGEASELLGVSIDTLRRWDENGRFPAEKSVGGHRTYSRAVIEQYMNDLFSLAKDWCLHGTEIPSKFYCSNSSIFQSRVIKMETLLAETKGFEHIYSLITAVVGEIGNNSFDHNLGNWPDIAGVFFGYDHIKRIIVLADRGQGILETLKRVKPQLSSHEEALLTGFTEVISGRAPEERGNGLKFVRKVVTENPMGLLFQTGDAELRLIKDGRDIHIQHSADNIRGCFAFLTF